MFGERTLAARVGTGSEFARKAQLQRFGKLVFLPQERSLALQVLELPAKEKAAISSFVHLSHPEEECFHLQINKHTHHTRTSMLALIHPSNHRSSTLS